MADDLAPAWLHYLRFAIVVTGMSAGVRVPETERYVTPIQYDCKSRVILALATQRFGPELYRAVIAALHGIAWMLPVFFVVSPIAYAIVRFTETRRAGASTERP